MSSKLLCSSGSFFVC